MSMDRSAEEAKLKADMKRMKKVKKMQEQLQIAKALRGSK